MAVFAVFLFMGIPTGLFIEDQFNVVKEPTPIVASAEVSSN
jgi:hypothetical protein